MVGAVSIGDRETCVKGSQRPKRLLLNGMRTRFVELDRTVGLVESTGVLAEALSNSRLERLFEHLTTPVPNQPRAQSRWTRGVAPGGRRKCGSVSRAIVEILSDADSELRVGDITKRAESVLGGPVSRGSVKGYLHRRSRGRAPVFEQTRRGHYRLLRDWAPRPARWPPLRSDPTPLRESPGDRFRFGARMYDHDRFPIGSSSLDRLSHSGCKTLLNSPCTMLVYKSLVGFPVCLG